MYLYVFMPNIQMGENVLWIHSSFHLQIKKNLTNVCWRTYLRFYKFERCSTHNAQLKSHAICSNLPNVFYQVEKVYVCIGTSHFTQALCFWKRDCISKMCKLKYFYYVSKWYSLKDLFYMFYYRTPTIRGFLWSYRFPWLSCFVFVFSSQHCLEWYEQHSHWN